jgi:hypothetical protein
MEYKTETAETREKRTYKWEFFSLRLKKEFSDSFTKTMKVCCPIYGNTMNNVTSIENQTVDARSDHTP